MMFLFELGVGTFAYIILIGAVYLMCASILVLFPRRRVVAVGRLKRGAVLVGLSIVGIIVLAGVEAFALPNAKADQGSAATMASLGLAAVVWVLYLRKGAGRARMLLPASNTYALRGDDDFEFDIVGESHYQEALSDIVGGKTREGHEFYCQAVLIEEPNNNADKDAIRVIINDLTVGYISRSDSKSFKSAFAAARVGGGPVRADAVIVGGWRRGANHEGSFGVKLDVSVPPVVIIEGPES